MKKLIFVFLILFSSNAFYANDNLNAFDQYRILHSIEGLIVTLDYSYERIFKDGIWWIYVYDEDGVLVNIYPDV